jgi:hypothetical protein
MISGAARLVTAAPALPAPKMPMAVPSFSFGNQAECDADHNEPG